LKWLDLIEFNLSSGAAHPYHAEHPIAFNTMEELLAQLEVAERERDEAVGELDEHNAQRRVEWLLFCMEVYNQRFYFGDLAK
jgi:hypothetical protein